MHRKYRTISNETFRGENMNKTFCKYRGVYIADKNLNFKDHTSF